MGFASAPRVAPGGSTSSGALCFAILVQKTQLSLTNRPKLPSGKRLRFIGLIFQLLPTPRPYDALDEGDSSSYRVHIWYGKTRIAGLQSGVGCIMIDSVIWTQYIYMWDTHRQTATSP